MNLFDIEHKIILVSGGCGVLGGGIAKYLLENKIAIYSILESYELEHLEYKYIEIIDSNIEQIDYAAVESLFKSKEFTNNFVESIYNILVEQEEQNKSAEMTRTGNT